MLDSAQRSQIYANAIRIINAAHGKFDWLVTRDQLVGRWVVNQSDIGADRIRVGNLLNQARRSWDYGRSLDRGEQPAGPPPKGYTAQTYGGAYVYRTVIEWVDPNTGMMRSVLVIVPSQTPLTDVQIVAQAYEKGSDLVRQQYNYPDRIKFSANDIITVRVVTAEKV